MSTIATSGASLRTFSSSRRAFLALGDDLKPASREQPGEPFAQQDAVLGDRYTHGISARHPGAAADGRPDPQPAAERLDPIGQAAQSRPRSVSAPPTPSSTTSTPGRRSSCHRRPRRAGLRMLVDVREALGDHVVGRHLDRLGQPAVESRPIDAPAPARATHRSSATASPCPRRHRGVEPASDVAQLVERRRRSRVAPRPRPPCLLRVSSPSSRLEPAELERQRHQSLLGAVVQVPFQAFSALLTGFEDVRAGSTPLRRAVSSAWRRAFSSAIPAAAPTPAEL